MMMKLSVLLVGTSVLVASAVPSFAHDWYSGRDIDARQDWQRDRIQRARRSGELTGHEYQNLMSEQYRVRELERRAKSDGVLTWRERDAIRNAQREAGRHIYREAHDRDGSWWRRWRWY
jgi:hypothetical protein